MAKVIFLAGTSECWSYERSDTLVRMSVNMSGEKSETRVRQRGSVLKLTTHAPTAGSVFDPTRVTQRSWRFRLLKNTQLRRGTKDQFQRQTLNESDKSKFEHQPQCVG
ncbi:hypothetical protein AgCh_001208 [Apium graveolens]